MSMVSKKQKTHGPEAVAADPDFQKQWCKDVLANPNKQWTLQVPRGSYGSTVTNAMFERTLDAPERIRAHLSFNRPSQEPDAITGVEECWLLSIGRDIAGAVGRTHGGFNAVILDQISGSMVHHSNPQPVPPATATLTVDYKAPVRAPSVILVRSWLVERSGRKVWVKAVIEDGKGNALCTSKGLFIFPRETKV